MQVFIYKKSPQKIYVVTNMANIAYFYSVLIQVKIKKNITEIVVEVCLMDINNSSSWTRTDFITH